MPAKYKSSGASHVALDLTKIALEQHLIQHTVDSKESAKNVVDYYNTIYDLLHNDENNQSQ